MSDLQSLRRQLDAAETFQRRRRIRLAISTVGFCSLLVVETLLDVGFWSTIVINVAWLAGIDLVLASWVKGPLNVS